mmetsp:Transcript_26617/g.37077  ORF Transcript_26617/g.37077 Transcript_26617/m.37077 type:complete len:144 (-) Transcript_26617:240-671(-)|eukprot:CAMPEP_0184484332 /NCGR_PEP_ID=MMETSP0113_2-20130426/6057_1 /TAXON_ID=91329 /ORGANISM="Norrisiella sphaerica, Strain BC52" /LENGTH=143 /DNA_ID=CAMNT_0026865283 /DNA_START=94 /DNA_END=525 /DNA_ORIENTATION=-
MVSERNFALIASVIANVALVIALTSVYSHQNAVAAPMAMRSAAVMPRFASRVAPRAMYNGRMNVFASNEEVFSKVQEIVSDQLSIDKEKVTETSTFADLGADSLDTVEIVMAIEEAFGVEVPEDAAAEMSNLKEAVDYIVTKA